MPEKFRVCRYLRYLDVVRRLIIGFEPTAKGHMNRAYRLALTVHS